MGSTPDCLVTPAHMWVPAHASSAGEEAADLAASAGLILDPEQRLVLDVLLAEKPDGRWAALEGAVIMARQNGKTRGLQALVLADLFLFGVELAIWTAHLFDTAQEAFRDIVALIDAAPHLSKEVRTIHRARGDEGIELLDGRRLNFLARSKTGGRGLSGDRVVLDEAFALTPSEMGSLLPTMSARPNPQVIYASSAGQVGSAVLRRVRDRGRKGGDPSLAYIEWAAQEGTCALDECDHKVDAVGCLLDDVDRWHEANPTLGRRMDIEHVAAERRALPPREFARERMGWWDPDPADTDQMVIDLEAWADAKDEASTFGEVLAWAVAPAADLSWTAIAAVGRREDGSLHVEIPEGGYRRGTQWVAERLNDLRERHGGEMVVMEARGPRSSIADDLEDLDVKVKLATGDEVVEACGLLLDSVHRMKLRHLGQPVLDVAVAGAGRRLVGDAWTWSRSASAVEISPLIAVTLAAWAERQDAGDDEPGELVSF